VTRSRPKYDYETLLFIARRDEFTCHVCGQGTDDSDPWVIDHKIPYARDRRHLLNNLHLAHASCNTAKGVA
jgi:5-methylcytosine-specific restriction endonuclease McrA